MSDISEILGTTDSDTFLGLPKGDLTSLEADVAILGAPCATPYRSTGTYAADAPKAIRAALAGYASDIMLLQQIDFSVSFWFKPMAFPQLYPQFHVPQYKSNSAC